MYIHQEKSFVLGHIAGNLRIKLMTQKKGQLPEEAKKKTKFEINKLSKIMITYCIMMRIVPGQNDAVQMETIF